MLPTLLFALGAAVADPTTSAPPVVVRKEGLFALGVSWEALQLGTLEAFGAGHSSAGGVRIGTAFDIDVGPQWEIRVPIRIQVVGSGGDEFGELTLSPGVAYRFRQSTTQTWVPYLGAGLKLGVVSAGHGLLGQPLVAAPRVPRGFGDLFDDHHHHADGSTGGSNPDLETDLDAGLELWAGVTCHPSRLFSIDFGLEYGYARVHGAGVSALAEFVGARFSF